MMIGGREMTAYYCKMKEGFWVRNGGRMRKESKGNKRVMRFFKIL